MAVSSDFNSQDPTYIGVTTVAGAPDGFTEAMERLNETLASGDVEAIAAVANEFAWPLATRHAKLLIEILHQLPQHILHKYENLRLAHPVTQAMMRAQPKDLNVHEQRDVEFLDEHQRNTYLMTLLVQRRMQGQVKSSLEVAERLEQRLQTSLGSVVAASSSLAAQFYFQIGYAYLLDGETRVALQSFSTARQLAGLDTSDHSQRDALSRSAVTHAFRGSLAQAEQSLESSRALPDASEFFMPSIAEAERIADTLVELERMGPHLDAKVRELDAAESVDELWPFSALIQSRYKLANRHPMAAIDLLSHAYETHHWEPDSIAGDIRVACLTQALLELGEISAAREVCGGVGSRLPLGRLARVRVLIFEGSFTEAARECRALSSSNRVSSTIRAEAMVLLAWITLETEERLQSSDAHALAHLALTGDFRRLFSSIPQDLVEALYEQLPEQDAAKVREALAGITFSAPVPRRPKLSPSEMKVLKELIKSAKSAEIAERLFVTQNTVKTQLASIYRKLGVRSRADAIIAASRMNLVDTIPTTHD